MHKVKVKNISICNDAPFTLIAGPCQIESLDHSLMMAEELCEITSKLNIPFIYKSSFDKANRTSVEAKRGIGLDESLSIFQKITTTFGCPTLTDVHLPDQCAVVASAVDVLQIPAFLCRQTDLLEAAAKTGKAINIKKGQFLAPWDMINVVKKMEHFGNQNIMLCERGVTFGYNNLVNDMRALPIMAQTGYPIVFDATHSVQMPGGAGGATSGKREFAPMLARAALSFGIGAVFLETHQDPDNAPSDGPNMIYLSELENILREMVAFDTLAKSMPRIL